MYTILYNPKNTFIKNVAYIYIRQLTQKRSLHSPTLICTHWTHSLPCTPSSPPTCPQTHNDLYSIECTLLVL